MQVAIHAEFMRSWARLGQQDRKLVEGMLSRIQASGITPGMRAHLIHSNRFDFLSLSPNMDLRVLGWREPGRFVLLYVDHHNAAYNWIEQNALKVEIAEIINYTTQLPSQADYLSPLTGETYSSQTTDWNWALEEKLASAGVPNALQKLLISANSDDELIDLLEFVSPEWRELILDAVLDKPVRTTPVTASNIWVAPTDEALRVALSLPLSQWRLFLHPVQMEAVAADTSQDLVVVGGPGTGKTVALVHRAVKLAQKCKPEECVVLVGHSPQAVENMKLMAQELTGAALSSLHVVDMIAIGRDGRPRDTDVCEPLSSMGGFLRHLGKDVVALLVDESQDIHGKHTRGWLFGNRPLIRTHVTLSADFNQNIFADNTNQSPLLKVLERARIIHLSYGYRVPREAGLLCEEIIRQQQPVEVRPVVDKLRALAQSMVYGFCSNFIRVFTYDNIQAGILKAAEEYAEMLSAGMKDVGIIYCGNRSNRNLYAHELEKLGYDPISESGILTPRAVKGREFNYCLVIAPELSLTDPNRPRNFGLYTVYVALSRCRHGLSVYTNTEFAALLNHPAVQHK